MSQSQGMSTGAKIGFGVLILLVCLGFILFGLSMTGVIGDSPAPPPPATVASAPPPVAADQKYTFLAEGGCIDDVAPVAGKCRSQMGCDTMGQQSNGCWHLLQKSLTGDKTASIYTKAIKNLSDVAVPDTLKAGESLSANQYIESADGQYKLIYQTDGNLVEYKKSDGSAVWASGTNGAPGQFIMQTDGNAVIYGGSNSGVKWASATSGQNYRFVIQNDGNIVIYNETNAPKWARFGTL